jgi:hypothetical protein
MPPPLELPVTVAFPAAPSWLVTRYVVSVGYVVGGQNISAGTGTLDHKGGPFIVKITANAAGQFPTTVTIDYTVEYTTESGLAPIVRQQAVAVGTGGASHTVLLPNRRLSETTLQFDFAHGVLLGDFLSVRWSYVLGTATVTSGAKFLDHAALLPGNPHPRSPVLIGLVLDPAPTVPEKLVLSITGRYFGKDLPTPGEFDLTFPRPLVVARLQGAATGGGFEVVLR